MGKFDHIEPKYRIGIIKGYRHFTLILNLDQKLVGRAVAWLVRPGVMQRRSQLSEDETLELRRIEREYEDALRPIWIPDHMNYVWLGNYFHEHQGHGHEHLIPRYRGARTFAGMEFRDDRWGDNYPQEKYFPPEKKFLAIRDEIRRWMPESERG